MKPEIAVIKEKVRRVISDTSLSNIEKRKKLNEIEKENPQLIFIKTNLCDCCNAMKIEVWVKTDEVSLKEEA